MAYGFDQIFAADPANPANIAQNASITIFTPGDVTMTPIAITDPDGQPLTNPIPVNANGFGSAFMADIDRVAWLGGGFTGFFTSYEGMKQVALDAQAAAETAASTAGAEAAVVATAAIGDATADATAAAASAATAASNASASATAAANSAALVGAPADAAIAAAINGSGATKTALNAAYATKAATDTAYSMAVRGFPKVTAPLKKLWFNAGVASSGIATQGAVGSVFDINDTTNYSLGDRSAKVTTNGTNGYTWMTKTGLTIDATGQYVRIWIQSDDITKVGTGYVFLGDATFANTYQGIFHTLTTEAASSIKSGDWYAYDIPWSTFTISAGAPNRAAITAVRIQINDANTGPAVVRWGGIGGVSEAETYPNGVVSLTFDDNFAEQFTVARPYLDKYGYAGTLYPIFDQFGAAGKMTLTQAKTLEEVHGWDFGFHAQTATSHNAGFNTLTEAQLVTEFEAMVSWAKANDVRGSSLAWPLGYSSKTGHKVAANYFSTARGQRRTLTETLPPSQRMELRSGFANPTTTLATLKAYVDAAKAGKTWAVLTFHGLVAASPTGNDWTIADFQALIDYINAQGVEVRTVSQVMNSI